jgi:type II secretory pathway component PulF
MERSGVFPPKAVAMMAAGERSGNIGSIALAVADLYEKETEFQISRVQRGMLLTAAALILAAACVSGALSFLSQASAGCGPGG